MSRRIKVLQIQPEYNVKPSSISDLAEQIVKSLPSDQYEVTSAYIYGKPKADQPVSIAEHTKYFDFQDKNLTGLRLKVLLSVYRYCRKERFDVIICNRFKIVSLLLQINKLLRAPVCIGISHVMDEYRRPYRRWQIKLLADKHWAFVGVSQAVKERLINYNIGFNNENTFAITNAIDIDQAESTQLPKIKAREKLDLPIDKTIIGAIGSLIPRKGHCYLIAALDTIKDKFPNAHIGIFGKGSEENNLRSQIQRAGLEDRVHLLGFKPDALKYVKAFDVWTMPSLSEGLGLALLEGMCGHLPIIASDIPAMAPLIEGAGGIAVKPKDVEALVNALDHYLSLPNEKLIEQGEMVFQYLKVNHSIENYRSSYRNLIEKKLKEHGK